MRVLIYCTIAALLSAGCASDMRTPITTADVFHEAIVDRPLAGGERWTQITIKSDGTMAGLHADGAILTGSWAFENGSFCREAIVDGASFGSDCQTVSVDGDSIIFGRNRGRGEQVSYYFR